MDLIHALAFIAELYFITKSSLNVLRAKPGTYPINKMFTVIFCYMGFGCFNFFNPSENSKQVQCKIMLKIVYIGSGPILEKCN